MKTAVEYLIKEFSDIIGPLETTSMQDLLMTYAVKKAKEMEKKQIIESYKAGVWDLGCKSADSEEYYNRTFKQEEQ